MMAPAMQQMMELIEHPFPERESKPFQLLTHQSPELDSMTSPTQGLILTMRVTLGESIK
jgi:hypothetical protein